MSRTLIPLLALPALALLAACGSDAPQPDAGLQQDLSLAAQAYPYQPILSPAEQGYAAGYPNQGGYRAPGGNGGYYPVATRAPSSGTIYRAPTPTGTARQPSRVVKNTKRDAAIGAAAGAVIGAVTSRDKLKGAVIGAAAGGLLGAVLGNNVDKKRVPD
jgi:YMGG-like Gly-zipper